MSSKEICLVPLPTEFDENTEEGNVVRPPAIETAHLPQRDEAGDNAVPLVPVGQQMDESPTITGESTDELVVVVDNEGAVILQGFVVDLMNADEIPVPQQLEVGNDIEHLSTELARTLIKIWEENPNLRHLVSATLDSTNSIAIVKETAKKILNETTDWGCIVLLLYLIYKIILKNRENIPYVNEVFKTIGPIFMAINNWIQNNGGWGSIQEYYHSITLTSTHTAASVGGIVGCVFAFALSYFYFKKNK